MLASAPASILNVWPPRPQGVLKNSSGQSASTYPVSGSCPGQDGDPRSLVLIITAVSIDRSICQASRLPLDCQAIFFSTTRRLSRRSA